jgi:beta-RFAP synthase
MRAAAPDQPLEPFSPLEIVAPARLHFGLLSFGHAPAANRRQYGGIGVMLREPALRLRLQPAEKTTIAGNAPARAADDVDRILARLKRDPRWGANATRPPGFLLEIWHAPPAHVGLGSGTQLGLAIAAALSLYYHVPPQNLIELVQLAQRGERSAIGSYGFLHGGMLIEPGKTATEPLAPLLAQICLPADWHVLLILPLEQIGLSGETESAAFAVLPPVTPGMTHALTAEILLGIWPAAKTGDFTRFSASVYRYGLLAGECFAAIQGGPFINSQVAALVRAIRARGVTGVGQSSWGPLIFAWFESLASAEDFASSASAEPSFANCRLIVTAPACHGATVNGQLLSSALFPPVCKPLRD